MPRRVDIADERARAARRFVPLLGFAVLFYGLGAAASGALVAGGAYLFYADGSWVSVVAGTVLGGLLFRSVFSSLWKRPTPFEALGPDEEPAVRAFVAELAARVSHDAPDAIALATAANAFAAHGPALLTGDARPRKRRVVGIGVPFLAFLERDELAAIVCHEFGHHLSGHFRLGPWVHVTRARLARALDALDGAAVAQWTPFSLYAKAFLRASARASRVQELEADAVARRAVGMDAVARALARTARLGPAWHGYVVTELVPLLAQDVVPPVFEGFARFARACATEGSPAARACASGDDATDVLDTHPPLLERLDALASDVATREAAVGDVGDASDVGAPRSRGLGALARDPLVEADVLEARLVRALVPDPDAARVPVAWEDIGDKVWLPMWRAHVAELGPSIEAVAPSALAEALDNHEAIAFTTRRGLDVLSREGARLRVVELLGMRLAVALADEGFRCVAEPGQEVELVRGDDRVAPFVVARALGEGTLDRDAWRARATTLFGRSGTGPVV